MKRTLSLLLIAALALAGLSGCAPASAAKRLSAEPVMLTDAALTPAVGDALSEFGLELLQNARTEGEGTLLSPLSVALALSMAANGAEGDTLAQFEEVLGGRTDLDTLNAACRALMDDYQKLGGSTQASIANSLWVDPDGMISDDFIGRCMGIFDAEVFQGELSAPGIVGDLNRWISDKTNELIPEMVNKPFSENTAALLVNALYLKNTWARKFDPNATRPMVFHHGPENEERMDFLNAGPAVFPYLQTEGAQGVVLPYDDRRLAFFALLPDLYPDSPVLGEWLDTLNGAELTALLTGAEEAEFLHLGLPKFEAEWKGELQEILPELGLNDAFTPGLADFSAMGDHPEGYYISQVLHTAKIKVNEKGTEAAAATVVATAGSSAPPEEGVRLVFDRPFLYGIFDLENGVPLFLGTYE